MTTNYLLFYRSNHNSYKTKYKEYTSELTITGKFTESGHIKPRIFLN